MALSERGIRAGRTAPRRRAADPDRAPFSSFLERDQDRVRRKRNRRRTIFISVGFHVVVFAALLVYSLLNVEELFGPSVEVKIFTPGKLPAGVSPLHPKVRPELPPSPAPAPAAAPSTAPSTLR